MIEQKKRIQIFDIAKGISIILMTISHYQFTELYPYLDAFQKFVMVFKMPTFIFISGYLLNNNLNFKHFLNNKIDGLLKPLLAFLLSLTLLRILFYITVTDGATLNECFELIKNLGRAFYHGSFDGMNVSFWFIGALFLGQVTLKLFLEITNLKKPVKYLLLILFAILLLILNIIRIKFYWSEYIPIFFTYLLLGYSFKKISVLYLNGTSFFYSKKMILFPILFLIFKFVIYKLDIKIHFDLSGLLFNHHYLLLLSLLGVFSVIFLCRYIEKIPVISPFLVYCSKASFFILAYHIFIKDVYAVMFNLENYNPLFHTFLFFLNIVLCCLIYMSLKKVPLVRLLFYPIKTIPLNDTEIKLLSSKYIYRFIPKNIFNITNVNQL